jgi:pyruvate/2-oxoglutarate dehydrogenase complex dihydrolipoamide dehydrogenase (E3) component
MINSRLEPDPFDASMFANVRPSTYRNPKPANSYNLVVIGAGPAGLVAAAGAAGLGAKVALVEREFMGGDCLFAGCVPSKALIRSARAAADGTLDGALGLSGPKPVVDFPRVMDRLRRLRAQISANDSVQRFVGLGIDVFLCEGRFAGRNCVEVGGETLRFARALIATGSGPVVPDILGLKETGFDSNLTIFELREKPESLIVLGGGPIGCELAQAFQRLGTRVTILQSSSRLMARDDADAVEIVRSSLIRDGVDVQLNARVIKTERKADGHCVVTFEQAGQKREVTGARILVATGRKPQLGSLNLNAAGVESDAAGVVTDDFLRTTNPRIYAAGDVCSKYKFTHAADAMARLALRNALFFGRSRVSKLVIPWATYTDPEVAQVGMTAEAAESAGISADVLTVSMKDVDRAILDGQTAGFGRLVLKKGTGILLGATLVAPHAGDMISEIALAMTAGLKAGMLSSTIHPYPTIGEIWRKLGDSFNRTRLTPRTKSILTKLLSIRNA